MCSVASWFLKILSRTRRFYVFLTYLIRIIWSRPPNAADLCRDNNFVCLGLSTFGCNSDFRHVKTNVISSSLISAESPRSFRLSLRHILILAAKFLFLMRSETANFLLVNGHLLSWLASHVNIASASYEWPSREIKGFRITSCVMGQTNSSGTSRRTLSLSLLLALLKEWLLVASVMIVMNWWQVSSDEIIFYVDMVVIERHDVISRRDWWRQIIFYCLHRWSGTGLPTTCRCSSTVEFCTVPGGLLHHALPVNTGWIIVMFERRLRRFNKFGRVPFPLFLPDGQWGDVKQQHPIEPNSLWA